MSILNVRKMGIVAMMGGLLACNVADKGQQPLLLSHPSPDAPLWGAFVGERRVVTAGEGAFLWQCEDNWRRETLKLASSDDGGIIQQFALSKDREFIAIFSIPYSVQLIEIPSKRIVLEVSPPGKGNAVAVSDRGRSLFVGSTTGSIWAFNKSDALLWRCHLTVGPPDEQMIVRWLKLSTDQGTVVALASSFVAEREVYLCVIDAESGSLRYSRNIRVPAIVTGAELAPDEGCLALALVNGTVAIVDLPSGKMRIQSVPVDGPTVLAYSHDGRQLAVAGRYSVTVIDARNLMPVHSFVTSIVEPSAVDFSSDSGYLLVSGISDLNAVELWRRR